MQQPFERNCPINLGLTVGLCVHRRGRRPRRPVNQHVNKMKNDKLMSIDTICCSRGVACRSRPSAQEQKTKASVIEDSSTKGRTPKPPSWGRGTIRMDGGRSCSSRAFIAHYICNSISKFTRTPPVTFGASPLPEGALGKAELYLRGDHWSPAHQLKSFLKRQNLKKC